MLKIAVLSGKGGTGKTFISTNLSNVIKNCTLLDMDVEEPNSRLFFNGKITKTIPVSQRFPVIDYHKCNNCRICSDNCRFNAIAFVGKPIIIENICHNCGLCSYLCPTKAISEVPKEIGHLEILKVNDNLTVKSGFLNLLEESGTPIIEALNNETNTDTVVIDCPPGSSCLAMEAIKDSDFNVLVSEDTNFSFDNFVAVYELSKLFNKKTCIVINKKTDNVSSKLVEFAKEHNVPVLLEVPFSKEIAHVNGNAHLITNDLPDYKQIFEKLYNDILKEVA